MRGWEITYDWPIGTKGHDRRDADAQVTLRARITGPDAARARALVGRWFETLLPLEWAPTGHGAVIGGVWMARFGVGTDEEPLIVDLHSAGEDAVESVHTTSRDLVDVLAGLDVEGTWEQLPLRW